MFGKPQQPTPTNAIHATCPLCYQCLSNYLQRNGLDTSIMQFPAVPKNEGRIRMFVTSEHTKEQIEKAAAIVIAAARKFEFALEEEEVFI